MLNRFSNPNQMMPGMMQPGMGQMGPMMGPTQFGAPLNPGMPDVPMGNQMLQSPGMTGMTASQPDLTPMMSMMNMGRQKMENQGGEMPYTGMAQGGLDRMQQLAMMARQRMGY